MKVLTAAPAAVPDAPAPGRPVLPWALITAVVLTLGFGLALRLTAHNAASDQRFYDAKMYYVAGLLYRQQLNPYDPDLEYATSIRAAPAGEAVGLRGEETFVNFPASLPPSAALSYAGWPGFGYAMTVLSVFSLVGCCWICVRLAAPPPGRAAVAVALLSVAAAAMPATWQMISLGQIALPVLLAGLGVIAAVGTRHNLTLFVAAVVVLLKVTMAPAFLLVPLVLGTPANRRTAIAAGVAFGLINAATALPVGLRQAVHQYRSNVASVVRGGGINDPDGVGRFARIDARPLWSPLGNHHAADLASVTTLLLLTGVFVVRLRRFTRLHAAAAAAGLTAISAYHRQYDAVLLIPVLAWTAALLLDRRAGPGLLLLALIGVELASFGEHGPFSLILHPRHRSLPWWITPTAQAAMAVFTLLYLPRLQARPPAVARPAV